MDRGTKVARLEVQLERTKEQNSMLNQMRERLQREKESLERERTQQALLQTSLQSIQNNLERSQFETKSMFTSRIEQLERENSVVKKKLEESEDHGRQYTQSLERQLSDARDRLAHEETAHARTSTELRKMQQDVTTQEAQLSELRAQLEKMQAEQEQLQSTQPLVSAEAAANAKALRDLKDELAQEKLKLSGKSSPPPPSPIALFVACFQTIAAL